MLLMLIDYPPVNNIRPSSDAQSGPISNVPTTSHMAYLRERYRSQCLSEESYRPHVQIVENQNQTNHMTRCSPKWERWCFEWGSDPISGPVTEVANFLAYLYKGGLSV